MNQYTAPTVSEFLPDVQEEKPIITDETVYRHTLRVYYEDTDAGGVVNHAAYLNYLERARTEMLHDMGYSNRQLKTLGVMVVVRRLQVAYMLPAHLEDDLIIETSVLKLRRVGATFRQEIFRAETKILDAVVDTACIKGTGGVTSWPPLIYSKFQTLFSEDE